ncbi:MAG: ATP-binding protein [Bacteroides sp.]|nr:ATP-binding protein [Bacteroides sp.]MCM1548869.1 ATP-binding protein [Clostridium sp.]
MDKEQFCRNIQEADNNSLRIGAANRIVQLLDKQRYSNNENSVKRWIWELCQNAKDVSNDTGKVKISINFNKTNNNVIFRHNGRPFTMANVMSLINQSSSKDRYDGSERKSGKFGTGFITTHLLSEIVNVSGIIEVEKAKFSRFQITLDRTGHDKNEIVSAMENAVEQLQACQPVAEGEITADEYNTIFEYKLDNEGVEVAQQGIDNLRVSAPFVLSMLKDIEEIVLEATKEKYKYSQSVLCGLDGSLVHEIIYESDVETKKIYVLNLTEENTTVSIALERREDGTYILPFAEQQSKLFCDFPLIGTEDFPFPILVCASDFNPTEPRDGIYLTCKSKTDDKVDQNRIIIERACRLYEKLLRYVADKKWEGIYNITRIDSYGKREWIDEEWIEKIVQDCKSIILHTPIIHTSIDSMVELQDCFDEEQIYVISDSKAEMREKIWDLLFHVMPEKIPCKEDIHNWYHSLWNDCNKYTFKSLTKQINDFGNAMLLQREIKDKDWRSWISQYYNPIDENKGLQTYVASDQINIIPNQNGVFCHVGELYFDKDILDKYKDILKLLDSDCRGWLLDLEFRNRDWFQFKDCDNEQILKLIENNLDNVDKKSKSDILLQMVWLYVNEHDDVYVQRQICQYANSILKIGNQMIEVQVVSDRILQESMKHTITCVADRISEYGCVQAFSQYMEMSQEEAVRLLTEFIEFIVKQGYDNLINKSTKPILPNQNGNFMIKDDIFLDNEIDETLKELAVSAGYDIKAELLISDISLDLPESRWKNDMDLSLSIIQYVNSNRSSKEEEVRNNFKKLLIWMRDYEERAKEIFPDLYKNKHYLYDDEQILDDIKQADTLKHLMQKFNVSSPEKLEELLTQSQMQPVERDNEKIELTQDVLLQLGIDSEEALNTAFNNVEFASKYIRTSKHDTDTYEYVRTILERSKKNILSYLDWRDEYDITDMRPIANTIFIIKKNGKEIYLLARPSDGGEVRIFYETEKDLLDYSMEWELWVEDGRNDPQKITFGKIIKLTGLNRIPLKGM